MKKFYSNIFPNIIATPRDMKQNKKADIINKLVCLMPETRKAFWHNLHVNSRVQTGRARPASLAREPIVRPVWTALGLPRAHVGSPERRSAPSHALSVFADAQRRLSLSCSLGVDGRKDTREPVNEKWIKKTVFA